MLLYFINTNMMLFIIPISFLFGVFTTTTEITEPSTLKILIKDQDSTSVISTYEIRTRGVQLLAPTLCGILISLSLFSPYIAVLFVSLISITLLLNLNLPHTMNQNIEQKNLFKSIKEPAIWLKKTAIIC